MFKFNEKYVISVNDKDKGVVSIYGICKRKQAMLKKRFYKTYRPCQVVSFLEK